MEKDLVTKIKVTVAKKEKIEEESKVWVKNDEILYIRIGNLSSKEKVLEVLEKVKQTLKEFPDKEKVLINLGVFPFAPPVHSSLFRKQVAEKLKEITNEAGYKKVAAFGGNTVKRTITSFVIVASGIKNIKVLGTKEEALKWLKRDS